MKKALLLALTLSTTLISGNVRADDKCPDAPEKTGRRVPYTGSAVPFPGFAVAAQEPEQAAPTPPAAAVRRPGAPTLARTQARGNHPSVARKLFQSE